MEIAKRSVANQYRWGDGGEGWRLVRSDGVSVIQEYMPPGTTEVRHAHQHSRQFFFVLAGVLRIEVNDTAFDVTAWTGLEIPPGTVHQVRNDSTAPVDFLGVSAPPSHGDRVLA